MDERQDLTAEQKEKLLWYRNVKWKPVAESCDPLDMGGAIAACDLSYKCAEREPPKVWFAFDSPLAAGIAAMIIVEALKTGEVEIHAAGVDWESWHREGPLTADILKLKPMERLELVGREAIRQFNAQNGSKLKVGFLDRFYKRDERALVKDFDIRISEQICGSHDAAWLAFYDFFLNEIGLQQCEKARGLFAMAHCSGWWAPYRGFAVFQHRQMEIHVNEAEEISSMQGPAIRYRDGYRLYVMHGVQVSEHIAETPADQLDPRLILTEKNVEVRREIARKIGAERYLAALNSKVIETQAYDIPVPTLNDDGSITGTRMENHRYDLLELDLGDGQRRPYLKMLNPSIGVYTIEGVPPETRTVMEAIKFRNGGLGLPAVIS